MAPSDDIYFTHSPTKALDNDSDGSFKVRFNAIGLLHNMIYVLVIANVSCKSMCLFDKVILTLC